MYEPRTATVVGTIVKNGPNTRANMRVRICDCSAVLIALPPSSPMMITDQWSVCQTTGRIAPMARLVGVREGESVEARDQVLITSTELADLIQAGDPLTVLDVRWRLDEPDGRPAYLEGHIPGAVYVSLEDELSDHTIAGRGRHPLPSGRDLEVAARRWGIRPDSLVVVYDDWNRAGSARAWWVLTAAGLPKVRILDGGLSAWRAAGRRLCAGAAPRSSFGAGSGGAATGECDCAAR